MALSDCEAVWSIRTLPHYRGLVFVTGCPTEGLFAVGATVFEKILWVVTKVSHFDDSPDPQWPCTEVVWCRPAIAAETITAAVPAKVAQRA
ncbi:MAG: hypothetical protein V2J55_04590 [Candidatus Competibacteraceae bacterium]|jgi:hypothetical protein|nr:hypothetical protein [Candidatus Competibacteraceae bacterium]